MDVNETTRTSQNLNQEKRRARGPGSAASATLAQASVLYAIASEYQSMAAAVESNSDMRALDNLVQGYTALAKQREAKERKTTIGARRSADADLVATQSSKTPSIGQHALVVDDSADVLVSVGAFLTGEGYVLVSAADGDTALGLIANDPKIDILITDYVMPGLSGVDLITQALQMRPDLRVLLITGYPNADGLKELSSHIKVLTKPFRRATLIAQLKTLVRESLLVVPDEVMVLAENR